jgi:small subunit ribosomal protein S16
MVKIRLMRRGATKRPFYRVVVADSRSPRDGRFIENIGKYHPLEDPSLIEIDADRALHWLANGAQPTEQVTVLLKVKGIWEQFEATKQRKSAKPAKKGAKAPKGSKAAATVAEEADQATTEASTEAAEETPAAPPEKRGRKRRAAAKKSS